MNLQNQINYLKEFYNEDMFDGCSVPAGLEMERVRGAIVMRCGLLTPLYSEPEVQKAATQQFFFENQWNFRHIVKILNAEYSPIENVAEWKDENATGETLHVTEEIFLRDEKREGSDTRNVLEQSTGYEEESTTKSASEGGTTSTADGGATSTADGGTTSTADGGTTRSAESGTTGKSLNDNKTVEYTISAENATTYQNDRKETEISSGSETVTHGKTETVTHGKTETITHGKTETITHGKTETITHGKTDSETGTGRTDREEDKNTSDTLIRDEHFITEDGRTVTIKESGDRGITLYRHGNVGVTTNQHMINEELDLITRFNAYRFIADLYEKEMMLGIY